MAHFQGHEGETKALQPCLSFAAHRGSEGQGPFAKFGLSQVAVSSVSVLEAQL